MSSIDTRVDSGMHWSEPRVDSLKKLWADGLSASQIAAELGGITRNAVVGKVHRLGLSGRAKSPSSSSRPRKPRRTQMVGVRPSMRGNSALANGFASAFVDQAEPVMIEEIVPIGQRRTLVELNENTCRWPIGDPCCQEFFFCGGAPVTGHPYCSYHSMVAYQPPAVRRDRHPGQG